jgi:hypothetical protein
MTDHLRWEDTDSHLQAFYRRQQAQGYMPERVLDPAEIDYPEVRDDPYAERAREQLAAGLEPSAFVDECANAHKEFLTRQRDAQLAVRMADKLGEEVPADIRQRAQATSAQEQVDELLDGMRQTRSAALREVSRSAWTPVDERWRHRLPDPTGDALERERVLSSYPQITKHREMAHGDAKPARRWYQRP